MARATKRDREGQIFQAFLDLRPLFATELIEGWDSSETDPPDIVCSTSAGRHVGVELKSWVHEFQIATKRPRGNFFESTREILGLRAPKESDNIQVVLLRPTKHVSYIRQQDKSLFRSEIYRLIAEVDKSWQQNWEGPQGCCWRDFSSYPTLSKYLDGLGFWPKRNRRGKDATYPSSQPWIVPGIPGGWFSEQSSKDSLSKVILKALKKYDRQQPELQGLDEFCLLIHYDENALLYNSPAETSRFKFKDYAREAKYLLRQNGSGPFDRIFLLIALYPDPSVFDLSLGTRGRDSQLRL